MLLILKHMGYAVTTACDGFEACERVRKGLFDVIFLDVKMPGMNGLETYRKVRHISSDPVVIMMSGYADRYLVEAAPQEGVQRALDKPFDVDKVLKMLGEILDGKRND